MFGSLLRATQKPVIGTFVKIPAIEIAEIVARSGYDLVVIDTEHAPLSVRDVYELVVTYSNLGVAPLVRITDQSYGDAQRYLDAGAAGVVVPHVSNGVQAARIMGRFLFPPHGTRGAGFAARAGLWGALEGGLAEYVRVGQDEAVRVAMLEDVEAVEDIAAILEAPGVDAICLGPGDLAMSMGVPLGAPDVLEAQTRVIEAAVEAGTPVGTVVSDPDQIRLRASQGCSFLLVGNDTGWLLSAARSTIAEIRSAIGDT